METLKEEVRLQKATYERYKQKKMNPHHQMFTEFGYITVEQYLQRLESEIKKKEEFLVNCR